MFIDMTGLIRWDPQRSLYPLYFKKLIWRILADYKFWKSGNLSTTKIYVSSNHPQNKRANILVWYLFLSALISAFLAPEDDTNNDHDDDYSRYDYADKCPFRARRLHFNCVCVCDCDYDCPGFVSLSETGRKNSEISVFVIPEKIIISSLAQL